MIATVHWISACYLFLIYPWGAYLGLWFLYSFCWISLPERLRNPILSFWHKGTYFNYERNFWAFFDPPSPLYAFWLQLAYPPLEVWTHFLTPPPSRWSCGVGTHFGALWKFYWMSFLCVLSTTVSFSKQHFCQQHDHICACFTMLIRTFTLLLLWHGSSLRMQKSIAGSKCLNIYTFAI